MSDTTPFPELLGRVRQGDAEAAEILVRRYEQAIRREVRLRLRDVRVRRLVDASDICQMVLGSFFVRAALGQFDLTTPGELLNLLMQIARNKITDAIKHEHAQRRGGEQVIEALEAGQSEVRPVPASGPTPSEYVANRELVHVLLARMTPDEQRVCQLRHAGNEWAEIAAQLGEDADTLRKRYRRAIDRIANEMKLDSLSLA